MRKNVGPTMNVMKRQMLEEHLAEAERHVAEGERLIEDQRARIEERRRGGLDVELATQLLEQMERAQRMHVEDRDRLRREQATSDRA
jgi:hypothetical protein